LATALPALAIFAAPGGMLLLAALVKLLPQSFLPAAFQEPESPSPPAPSQRAG
jgi:hypothetical protein